MVPPPALTRYRPIIGSTCVVEPGVEQAAIEPVNASKTAIWRMRINEECRGRVGRMVSIMERFLRSD